MVALPASESPQNGDATPPTATPPSPQAPAAPATPTPEPAKPPAPSVFSPTERLTPARVHGGLAVISLALIGQIISADNISDQLHSAVGWLTAALLINAVCYVMEADPGAPRLQNVLVQIAFLSFRAFGVITATTGIGQMIAHVSPAAGANFTWAGTVGLLLHALVHQRQFMFIRHACAAVLSDLRLARIDRRFRAMMEAIENDHERAMERCRGQLAQCDECSRLKEEIATQYEEQNREVESIQEVMKGQGIEVKLGEGFEQQWQELPADVQVQLRSRMDKVLETVADINRRDAAVSQRYKKARQELDKLLQESRAQHDGARETAARMDAASERLRAAIRHHTVQADCAKRAAEEWLPRIMRTVEPQPGSETTT